jgi:transposase
MRKSASFTLSDGIRDGLTTFAKSYSCPGYLHYRASIILNAERGLANGEIGSMTGFHPNTVRKWRTRFFSELPRLLEIEERNPEELMNEVTVILSDGARSGAPRSFDCETRRTIQLLACQNPSDYGFVASHWSLMLLKKAVENENVVESISAGAIYHILLSAEIKPWKIRYYLHSKEKYESYETFCEKVRVINDVYAKAAELKEKGTLVYCTDEMTGLQALEHAYPGKDAMPGMAARRDFNYIRHGTTAFIGFFNVQDGTVFEPYLKSTRCDADFRDALSLVIDANPDKRHLFVLDNLNIHKSEALVRYVAEKIGYSEDLGVKSKKGILKNKESRAAFLSDERHSIRFCFVPIHCSWMNQIEIWFGILNKKLLKRASFKSVEELQESIRKFVKQHNAMFAHPYRWTYDSVPEIKKYDTEKLLEAIA